MDAALTSEAWTLLAVGCAVGMAAVIGGLSAQFHDHELLALWGIFPILAGCMGGVELINPLGTAPTQESVRTKHRWVQHGIALLVFSILIGIAGALLIVTAP